MLCSAIPVARMRYAIAALIRLCISGQKPDIAMDLTGADDIQGERHGEKGGDPGCQILGEYSASSSLQKTAGGTVSRNYMHDELRFSSDSEVSEEC
jgi:hypothetical protein